MPLRGLSAVVRLDCWAREKACDLWDGQQSESHAFLFVEAEHFRLTTFRDFGDSIGAHIY